MVEILTSDLNLVGTMNANSFESLTMTNGGAVALRRLLKQAKNVAPNTKLASADQNSTPGNRCNMVLKKIVIINRNNYSKIYQNIAGAM